MAEFIVGDVYSRKDIFQHLKIEPMPTGGNWFTGYTSYAGEHYVFVNINTFGRTGHFYGDHWTDEGFLHWYGKTNSHYYQPIIQKMLDKENRVHIFTRDNSDQVYFTYQGVGIVQDVKKDAIPVEVIWKFN